ncbi:MAG: helix-turn-helix domain-containing protein [bacterium]|uniref:Helix-turn-helix domain-containing protein n=1 Tax=Candidatus Methylomirabilis tolerans TaxID=3123416 RepID=A0AAJ1AIY8_9BACT|nr:helix-turn-helix domain-containing protein [Candidatus Methylomirabilis sp.]
MYGSLTFPRPCVPPSGYPAHPRSLGEHLRKRRLDLGLFQNQVANQLGVDEMTVVYWEKARIKPSVRQLPKLVTFLGYVPFECPPDPLGRLRYCKLIHGLSYGDLARALGTDDSVVTGWLAWKHRPSPRSVERIDAFLRTKALPAPPAQPTADSWCGDP